MSTIAIDPVICSLERPMIDIATRIDGLFDQLLAVPEGSNARLWMAMRHAAIGGGKRLRPLLVCASGALFGVSLEQSLYAGLAAECIHVHSLIHDDLPCMDNDDLRRGKPTVHVAFDQATAVLAGDALLALAFEILGDAATHADAERRCELAAGLAHAAGAAGMAGGQMLDLLAADGAVDLEDVSRLQRLKTGALIGWCVDAGAVLGGASSQDRTSLRGYAQNLGLAFQIADDLLDRNGDERRVGKKLGKDVAHGKESFVSLLGEKRAARQAALLIDQAIEHLNGFGDEAGLLQSIARFAIVRDH